MKNKLLAKITPEQLIQDFQQLGSAHKIAAKYGFNVVTVYTAFKIINYDCRVRQDVASLVTKEILEEAYERLGTIRAVGRELNIAAPTIKHYMKNFALDFKPQIRYTCDNKFFSRDNEESFYVAGFIAADGCVRKRGKSCHNLIIQLSNGDVDLLEKIRKILRSDSPIRIGENNNKKVNENWQNTLFCRLDITSKQIYDDLQRFNIVPRKSLTLTFPEWMKTHPLKHHFIRGYNDGDGCFCCREDGNIGFSMLGTKKFLTVIKKVLQDECNVSKSVNLNVRENIYCLAYWKQQDVKNIANYLYKDSNIFLPRKYDIVNKIV